MTNMSDLQYIAWKLEQIVDVLGAKNEMTPQQFWDAIFLDEKSKGNNTKQAADAADNALKIRQDALTRLTVG